MRLENYERPPDLSAGRVFFAMNSSNDGVDRYSSVAYSPETGEIIGRSARAERSFPVAEISLKPSRAAGLPGDEALNALGSDTNGDVELAIILILMSEWHTGSLRCPYEFAATLKTGFCRAERWVIWNHLSDEQKEWWLPILSHSTPPETPTDSNTGWPAPLYQQWITALTEAALGWETGPGWGSWDAGVLTDALGIVSPELKRQIFGDLPEQAKVFYKGRRKAAPVAA